jgi:hypothetical protein
MVRKEYAVIALLIALNIIIRYPVTPHELGNDAFFIHGLANSISEYGYAKWVIHPLSFFGLYPYSYASGVPHLLSICSSITGLGMECTIYMVSLLLGIIGIFGAFVMAGEFSDNFYFKALVAFIFSLSPLALKFTLWTVSTRGMLLMLLPLFIWCLLKVYKGYQHRYLFLSMLFFILLASAHKMFVLTLPIIAAYFLAILLPRIARKINVKHTPYLLLFLFIFLFFIQFLFIKGGWTQRYTPFYGGEWYYFLIGTIFTMVARLGFLIPLALVGLVVILFKKDRPAKDWFLIITVLLFTPLLGHSMYFYQILLPFYSLLSAIGISYLIRHSEKFVNQRYAVSFILIILICFSLFTLGVRYTNTDSLGYSNYMYESTYSLASFIQKETDNKPISGVEARRISAFVTNPTSSSLCNANYFVYDIIDEEELQLKRKSLPKSLDELFAFVKYPYTVNPPTIEYNAQYVVENENIKRDRYYNGDNKIYDNGLEELGHVGKLYENLS